ncbi:tRNA pseudouridine(55) synthase TruB [Luethyella okanaganae]|uniref:tRNA pseudouridine synthase B n=1 Tax=Luethyella okanaganae TaxID=69372 RepID=A0ABW1VKP9_9MICO
MTSGILLLDKPQGWTSHDVVARTRRLAGTRKVGHAGTLDPMATGLLVLGVDSSTRLLTYIVGLDKEYRATIRLGVASTTDDAEGELLEPAPAVAVGAVAEAAILNGIARLTGDIEQVPSTVSAIKVDGRRAYARVRAGEQVRLAARPVTVSAFELLSSTAVDGYLDLEVRVECSSGTYIRALARDLGATLGVGGHLTSLCRTRIGPFSISETHSLDGLDIEAALLAPAGVGERLFGRYDLDAQQAVDLGHGKRIEVAETPDVGLRAAIALDGRLIGLIELRGGSGKSVVNFPSDAAAAEPANARPVRPASGRTPEEDGTL